MNYKEKALLIGNSMFGGILDSLYFIYPPHFNFSPSVYFSLAAIAYYISPMVSSAVFGNLKINKKNYIYIGSIGLLGPLLSTLLLLIPNQLIFIFSYFLFNFTSSSTYFSFLLYYKDVKLNFYFSIYATFGSIIPQISSLILSIIYNLYLVAFLFLISIMIVLFNNIYLFLFTDKYELSPLRRISSVFSMAKNIFGGSIFPVNIKKLKIGYLEIYNFFVLIGFALIRSSLVYSVDKLSLSFIYPLLLFISGIYTSIFYKLYKRNISFRNIKIGILFRFLVGIIIFITLLLYTNNNIINSIIFLILFILVVFSWTMFQYFFDNYIINNFPERFGNISFFRNMGGTIGSLILYIIPISYGLIISFLILIISIFSFNYTLKG